MASALLDKIRYEALRPARDAEGDRALPLASHWNIGARADLPGWDPIYQRDLFTRGAPIFPWVGWPQTLEWKDPNSRIPYYEAEHLYRDYIRWLAANGMPFAMSGTQPEQCLYATGGKWYGLAPEANPCGLALNGTIAEPRKLDPLGPTGPWRECGADNTNDPRWDWLFAAYPEPPRVVWLSNNEAGKIWPPDLDKSKRYVDAYGLGTSQLTKNGVSRQGFAQCYRELFDGFRSKLPSGWLRAARFTGYGGANCPSSYARWVDWNMYGGYSSGNIAAWDMPWDGGSVGEGYFNTDVKVLSAMTGAMNWPFMIAEMERHREDYWLEMDVAAGQNAGSPAVSAERFGASVEWQLWLVQPRVVRHFNGWVELRQNVGQWWEQTLTAVERIWKSETLTHFWRRSALIVNPARRHPYQANVPPEYANEERMYLLSTSLDAPDPWSFQTPISVWALARRDESGDILLMAFSPSGATPGVRITVPGWGDVTVDLIPRPSYWRMTPARTEKMERVS